jgi:hypothetical protein
MKAHEEEWKFLCKQAAKEQDPAKLFKLVQRINDLLEAKEKRLRGKAVLSSVQAGNHVFQIAYDEMLLVTRELLLKDRGYEVTSVLGNEDARRALAMDQIYRLFIVGRDAPRETREAMVRWLKEHFPNIKVLALNPPYQDQLPGADFNLILNGPDEWLAVVASVAG